MLLFITWWTCFFIYIFEPFISLTLRSNWSSCFLFGSIWRSTSQASGFLKKVCFLHLNVCVCLCVCVICVSVSSSSHRASLSPSCSYQPSCSASALTWILALFTFLRLNNAVTVTPLLSLSFSFTLLSLLHVLPHFSFTSSDPVCLDFSPFPSSSPLPPSLPFPPRLSEEKLNLDASEWEDIHVITGALKLFFRELPEPLVPYGFFTDIVETVSEWPLSGPIRLQVSFTPAPWTLRLSISQRRSSLIRLRQRLKDFVSGSHHCVQSLYEIKTK